MFVVFIVGLIFFLVGLFFLLDAYNFRRSSEVIKGKVVGYEKETRRSSNNSSRSSYYYLVVEYFIAQRYRLKGDIGSSAMSYDIGDEVDVMVKNMDPSTARIKRPARLLLGYIFAFVGFVALAVFFNNAKDFSISWNMLSPAIVFLFALGYIYYKMRSKMTELGVSSISDMLSKTKNLDPDNTPLIKGEDGVYGYQPSPDFISSQDQIKTVPLYVHLIFLCLGIGMLVFGAQELEKRKRYLETAPYTVGKIVDQESSYSDGSTTYFPVVSYSVYEKAYTFKHNMGSSHPSWNVGDKVKVYYSYDNPKNALMDEGWLNYLWQGIVTLLGLILTLNGIKQSFFSKKRSKG